VTSGSADSGSPIVTGPPRGPVDLPGVPDGVVLYDGVCVLCSNWFCFVARRDKAARFRFTQIQGDYGRSLAARTGIDPDTPETNAVFIDGKAYFRSDAALMVLLNLPRWSIAARLMLAVPRLCRDFLYDRIARNRYRLFGRTETCLVPGPELRRHLLPETTTAS
jgi:predicted DCC family thiol-disulfide oxidoreductase YuxK